MVDGEHRKGHFPDVWVPHKPRKPCLLSPDGSTSSPVIATASGTLDVHTISGLQQALNMLGYRITIDGDYGPETRQSSRVSKCTPESSLTELPAHRQKQSCSPS
jgi:hypothetical protein